MTLRAVQAQGGRKEPHRRHELVHWDSSEHLDIREGVFGYLRFLLRPRLVTLATRQQSPQQTHKQQQESSPRGCSLEDRHDDPVLLIRKGVLSTISIIYDLIFGHS